MQEAAHQKVQEQINYRTDINDKMLGASRLARWAELTLKMKASLIVVRNALGQFRKCLVELFLRFCFLEYQFLQ